MADNRGCKEHPEFGNILNKKQTVFSIVTNINILYSHQLLKDHFKTLTCNCSQIFFCGGGFQEICHKESISYSFSLTVSFSKSVLFSHVCRFILTACKEIHLRENRQYWQKHQKNKKFKISTKLLLCNGVSHRKENSQFKCKPMLC